MHNLAIALHRNGHTVTGSDDVIYGISQRKLTQAGLLPDQLGWDQSRITDNIDLIILGMHAKADNPELIKGKELGIEIQSFPEYIANKSADKIRIVVAGSHGKTTTTSMLMHILRAEGIDFDYLVGAQLDGFDLMVKLSDAPYIVIEGDEYLSSAIDRRPKFVHYRPQIAIVTGTAWDHANVFPTQAIYTDQFREFLSSLAEDSTVCYDATDPNLIDLAATVDDSLIVKGYLGLRGSGTEVCHKSVSYEMQVFGEHNRKNMHAAMLVAEELGIDNHTTLTHMQSFKGAAMRQQVIKTESPRIYRDFGHAPSKVRATIDAVRENHPGQSIGVIVELHSYSSMLADFIPQYAGVFQSVDVAAVCVDKHAFEIKQMPVLTESQIQQAFDCSECQVIYDQESLMTQLEAYQSLDVVLLLSSGNLMGVDVV